MENLKVLIADDEPEILDIMAKKVFVQGYTVIKAHNGEEAWQKIQNESPDIIILDLNMPKKNGFEVLQLLREKPPEDKWQPVIIVSASSELDDVKKGLSLEAEHYIVKPSTIEDIIKAIRLVANLIPKHKSPSEIKNSEIG